MIAEVFVAAQNSSRRALHSSFLALVLLTMVSCGGRPDPLPGFPRLMLWAWERPERLSYVDPRSAGVAFLARTVHWQAGLVTSRPRYQPLELEPNIKVMAVIRLESRTPPLPAVDTIAAEILKTAELPNVQAIQIDFDARRSEREWYGELLHRVRRRLKPSLPLTVTALVSWCQDDAWIQRLPVSDAVPMLFRMGAGEPRNASDFSAGICRSSLGISTDEVPLAAPHGRRLFVFHPKPWTPDAYRGALQLARRWQ